jgi:DNA-binding response OmpR family regulator
MNMVKILIIDDDESILEAMQIAVESQGHDVETLKDGEKAAEVVGKFKPNLILLDLLLSGLDGIQVINDLKSVGINETPIIMISAHPTAKETALGSGATDFLAKPFELEELFSVINKYT